MTFEIAISTMHKNQEEVLEMLRKENIHCDCIVINQCDEDRTEEFERESQRIRIFYTTERGLSKSRNMALKNAQADILAIGDDDLLYYDNFEKTILDYYESSPKADVALFNMDDLYKTFPRKSRRCGFFELSGYISMEATFRVASIRGRSLQFNEFFGTGSKYFSSGEENIFLADCYHKKCKIFYCKDKIVKRLPAKSSWFTSYNDEKFIKARGAIYYAMSKKLFPLYILRFALLKRSLIRPVSSFRALKMMLKGRDEYKGILLNSISNASKQERIKCQPFQS